MRHAIAVAFILATVVGAWELRNAFRAAGFKRSTAAALIAVSLVGADGVAPSLAVSGGGFDYANKDLREESFAGKNEKGKDFTQCIATGVSFKGAVLDGARFFRSNLKNADFSGSSMLSASLEDTDMSGAIFSQANMQGAYFSDSIADVESLSGADLTDAQMPKNARAKLCARTDIGTANAKTGEVTKDTLFCE